MVLSQKTIVITGVTRGLGLAIAKQFIEMGHTVLGCGRSQERIASLEKKWEKPHSFRRVDVSRDREVEEWADFVCKRYSPDLLINNAAIINKNASLWDISAKEFSQVIDVNIKGLVL